MKIMKVIEFPPRETWPGLLERPREDAKDIAAAVDEIIETVRRDGDEALRFYGEKFDGVRVDEFAVSESEFEHSCFRVPPELKSAIAMAKGWPATCGSCS